MGIEVICACNWASGSGTVKALLESSALILRGDLKRRITISTIERTEIVGDELRIKVGEESISLHLGLKKAETWAAKLRAPLRSLREKLGLAGDAKALVLGDLSSDALQDALADRATTKPDDAVMTVAIVMDEHHIAEALITHGRLRPGAPIWIVHGKGKAAAVGESLVRTHMRRAGYMDNKVAAVSDVQTATRYSRADQG